MADTPMNDSTPLSNALPAMPLPSLPPLSSPAPLQPQASSSSSSSTPQPQVPIPATAQSVGESEPGPPKRKRARRSEGQPGPGKSWRKGLKGTLVAGAGIESLTASPTSHAPPAVKPSTPSAQPVVHYHHPPVHASSPLPAFNPTNRTASTLVGAPPKLATQFISPQVLELGAPRPRRWGRGKMDFRSITGGTILLTSWQGDSFSPYLDHVSTNSIDELASPPPQSHSYLPPPSMVPTSSGMKPSLSRTAPPQARYSPYSIPQSQPQTQAPSPLQQPQYQQQQQQRVYTPNLTLAPPTIPPYHHTPSAQSSPISKSVSPNSYVNSVSSYPQSAATPSVPTASGSGSAVGAGDGAGETKPVV